MRPIIVPALALLFIAACVRAPRPVPASPASEPAIVLEPPSVDLSGSWTSGSASEPPAGVVEQRPSCTHNPAVWLIEQSGNSLKAWLFPESFNQGIALPGPGPARVTPSPGTISGDNVVIDDGTYRLVLRYDAPSGHLRGTRNGAPFWAARLRIVRTEACPGVP